MIRDKLINLISDKLSIDKKLIFEDSNLRKLSILSAYLEGLDEVDKKKLKISRDGLTKNTFEQVDYKDDKALIDITSFFENNHNKSVIHKDWRGRDSFYNFQMTEVFIFLSIELEFDIQISDEKWKNILSVGQVITCIENTK